MVAEINNFLPIANRSSNSCCYYVCGFVFVTGLVVNGCTSESARDKRNSQQIKAVNAAIDKWNPSNTRLAQSSAAGEVKGSGFDFLLGRSVKDFPSLFQVADSDIASLEYHKEAIRKWAKAKNHSSNTTYLSFETNVWGFGKSSDCFDLLVIATELRIDASILQLVVEKQELS